jgi:hypothetical protein
MCEGGELQKMWQDSSFFGRKVQASWWKAHSRRNVHSDGRKVLSVRAKGKQGEPHS